jgi:hypothetical protein
MRNLIKILMFIVFVLSLAGCGTDTASLNPVNSEIQQMSQASTAMSSPAKGEVTSAGAIVDRFNFMEPIDVIITNPCNGEDVHFTGFEHHSGHLTINGNHVTIVTHINDVHVTGVGLSTGNVYNRVGNTQEKFTAAIGEEASFTESFKFISRKSDTNALAFIKFHYTVNANGDLTILRDIDYVICTN